MVSAGKITVQVPDHSGAGDGWQLTAVTRSMSSGKVCMKFMTLSLTGSLATPPSCTGDADEGREPLPADSEEEKTLEAYELHCRVVTLSICRKQAVLKLVVHCISNIHALFLFC